MHLRHTITLAAAALLALALIGTPSLQAQQGYDSYAQAEKKKGKGMGSGITGKCRNPNKRWDGRSKMCV